ncbi:hypothetical protein E2C01_100574 [Portunus trituberculatus]|uniref:Uncharacterized protein n=1 Tax=Portunus trituberculatus TaxID=210409 RepID=A0A5B7K8E0_PORTR|nr:hypothetical protein [Portunus trituberculatus]
MCSFYVTRGSLVATSRGSPARQPLWKRKTEPAVRGQEASVGGGG